MTDVIGNCPYKCFYTRPLVSLGRVQVSMVQSRIINNLVMQEYQLVEKNWFL